MIPWVLWARGRKIGPSLSRLSSPIDRDVWIHHYGTFPSTARRLWGWWWGRWTYRQPIPSSSNRHTISLCMATRKCSWSSSRQPWWCSLPACWKRNLELIKYKLVVILFAILSCFIAVLMKFPSRLSKILWHNRWKTIKILLWFYKESQEMAFKCSNTFNIFLYLKQVFKIAFSTTSAILSSILTDFSKIIPLD